MVEIKIRVKTSNPLPMAATHLNKNQLIQLEGEAQPQHPLFHISLQTVLHQQVTGQQQVDTFPGPEAVKEATVETQVVDQPTVPSQLKVIHPNTELLSDTPPRAHHPGETR